MQMYYLAACMQKNQVLLQKFKNSSVLTVNVSGLLLYF